MPSDELPSENHRSRKPTPKEAIVNFDGEIEVVRAHHVTNRCVTKPCLAFWTHLAALTTLTVVGLILFLVYADNQTYSNIGFSMFWGGIGGFLPGPKMKNAKVQ